METSCASEFLSCTELAAKPSPFNSDADKLAPTFLSLWINLNPKVPVHPQQPEVQFCMHLYCFRCTCPTMATPMEWMATLWHWYQVFEPHLTLLMYCLTFVPLPVPRAFAPRHNWMAWRIALFPEPFWPEMKLTFELQVQPIHSIKAPWRMLDVRSIST